MPDCFTLNHCTHAIYWLYVWKQHDSFLVEDYFWEPGVGQCIAKDKRFRRHGYSAEKTQTLDLEIRSSQTMAGRPSESTPTPHILPAWKCYFLERYLYEKQIRGKPFATRVRSFASISLWKRYPSRAARAKDAIRYTDAEMKRHNTADDIALPRPSSNARRFSSHQWHSPTNWVVNRYGRLIAFRFSFLF